MVGVDISPAGWVAGLDLVRGDDGVLRVLEDNLRTPSGIAYVAAARAALDAHLPMPFPAGLRDPETAFELLGAALIASAPERRRRADRRDRCPTASPTARGTSTRQIARRLELPIVRVADLTVRRNRLHARIGRDSRPVDVVYRRTDEDALRGRDGQPTWVAELLLDPVRAGTLAVVNPFGAGVADDKLVHAYVEEMIRFYLGEEPVIAVGADVRPRRARRARRARSTRIDELVVKPRFGLGGEGVVICPHATAEDRDAVARRVRDRARGLDRAGAGQPLHPPDRRATGGSSRATWTCARS